MAHKQELQQVSASHQGWHVVCQLQQISLDVHEVSRMRNSSDLVEHVQHEVRHVLLCELVLYIINVLGPTNKG